MMKLLLFLLFASQCPLAHGVAVFKARALLSIAEDTDYDDYTICNAMGLQPLMRPNEDLPSSIAVYPNPTSGILTVQYQIEQRASIYIFDVLGRQLVSIELKPTQNLQNVDVSGLPNGVYLYKISNDDGDILLSSSLIVSK